MPLAVEDALIGLCIARADRSRPALRQGDVGSQYGVGIISASIDETLKP